MINASQRKQLAKFVHNLRKRAEAGDLEAVRTLGAMVLLKASLEANGG